MSASSVARLITTTAVVAISPRKNNSREFAIHALTTTSSKKFSVGICAADSPAGLESLLNVVKTESLPRGFELDEIIVVASGCEGRALDDLKTRVVWRDPKICLVEEEKRTGKAHALNKIIERTMSRAGSELLVLVNSDALPERGAISELLKAAAPLSEEERGSKEKGPGVVSGRPYFCSENQNVTSRILELIWTLHNECSQSLNHFGISNHCSDELMAVRTSALRPLPPGLVNDGAYIAGVAKLLGYSIKFSSEANVRIAVPSRITEVLGQRRRIIFGHFQVWKLTKRAPKTIETMLLAKPNISIKIVVGTLAKRPRLILYLPFGLVAEFVSFLLAASDTLRSTQKHKVWNRYATH